MTRKFNLAFRTTLVATICALLVVSPATAGGLLKRLGCNRKAACPPPTSCCENEVVCCPTPAPAYCPPPSCELPCEPVMVCPTDPCAGLPMGEVIYESVSPMPSVSPEVMHEEEMSDAPPAPATEATEKSIIGEEPAPTEEPAAAAEPAAPAEEAASPSDVAEPIVAEELAPTEPSPFDEPAAAEEPAAEAEPSPFDEPAPADAPIPAEEPAPATEPENDPFDFGAPAEDAPPAPSTTEDAFDIFGDSPAASDAPGDAPVGDTPNDFFDDVPAADPPADAPAADAPVEGSDPFKDLLNPTSTREEDRELEEKRKSIFDELFGAIQQVPAWYAAAAEEARCQLIAQQHEASSKAVVSVTAAKIVPTIDQTEMRTWQDDTSTFSTEGRLILITETFVRLLKPNGRTCTVPVDRLSPVDATYVSQVAAATKAAQSLLALAN